MLSSIGEKFIRRAMKHCEISIVYNDHISVPVLYTCFHDSVHYKQKTDSSNSCCFFLFFSFEEL